MSNLVELFYKKHGRHPVGNVQDELIAYAATEIERLQAEVKRLRAESDRRKRLYVECETDNTSLLKERRKLKQECDQLKAQNNQLRTALKAMNSHLNYIPALDLTVDEVLAMSPNQSLAAHDVQMVRAAMDAARDACDGHETDSAMEYDAALCRHIDQLLEEAKEITNDQAK